ncbi:MAG: tail fiber domain-containing protein [Candidatus Symbiothrix sp.]|nr:tail fiber domain-containing protein [Candidatus Symbiothrix sp.]
MSPASTDKLVITNTEYSSIRIEQHGQTMYSIGIGIDDPTTNYIGGTYLGTAYLRANNTGLYATSFYSLSDENFKQNIADIQSPLSKVLQLRGVSYQLKPLALDSVREKDLSDAKKWMEEKYSKTRIGLVAQEVEKIIPEVVDTNEDGRKSVAYGEITGLLIEAIKEQQQEIEDLKKQLNEFNLNQLRSSETVTDISGTAIADCRLYQNAPNPFAQTTFIKFYLTPEIQTASLCVYDLQGKQLKQYPIQQRGVGSLAVSGAEFAAGMYFYALIADGQEVNVKKMILTE